MSRPWFAHALEFASIVGRAFTEMMRTFFPRNMVAAVWMTFKISGVTSSGVVSAGKGWPTAGAALGCIGSSPGTGAAAVSLTSCIRHLAIYPRADFSARAESSHVSWVDGPRVWRAELRGPAPDIFEFPRVR